MRAAGQNGVGNVSEAVEPSQSGDGLFDRHDHEASRRESDGDRGNGLPTQMPNKSYRGEVGVSAPVHLDIATADGRQVVQRPLDGIGRGVEQDRRGALATIGQSESIGCRKLATIAEVQGLNRIDPVARVQAGIGQHEIRIRHLPQGVDPATAIQAVDAGRTGQGVVAGAADQGVVARAPIEPDTAQCECARIQPVGTGASRQHDMLDLRQAAGPDVAQHQGRVAQCHVMVGAFNQGVGAATTIDGIDAPTAGELVVVRVANKDVVAIRSDHIAKTRDRMEDGCRAGGRFRGGAGRQIDADPGRAAARNESVSAEIERVRQVRAGDVFDGRERHPVGTTGANAGNRPHAARRDAVSGKRVASRRAADDDSDALHRRRAGRAAALQIDRDQRGVGTVVQHVQPGPAVDAASQHGTRVEPEGVQAQAPDQVLDVHRLHAVGQGKCRIFHVDGTVGMDPEDQVGRDLREVERIHAARVGFVHGVQAEAVVEDIGIVAGPSLQRIVAGHALNRVGAGACQSVGARRSSDRAIQQKPVGVEIEGLGLDQADAEFERPVAADRRTAGGIGRSCDIGTGDGSELLDKLCARVTGGNIAAIQQDVAARCQRPGPGTEFGALRVEQRLVHHAGAQAQGAAGAVCQDMDRTQPLLVGESFLDLVQAGAQRFEHKHRQIDWRRLRCRVGPDAMALRRTQQRVDDRPMVGKPGVDECDLAHRGDGLPARRLPLRSRWRLPVKTLIDLRHGRRCACRHCSLHDRVRWRDDGKFGRQQEALFQRLEQGLARKRWRLVRGRRRLAGLDASRQRRNGPGEFWITHANCLPDRACRSARGCAELPPGCSFQ